MECFVRAVVVSGFEGVAPGVIPLLTGDMVSDTMPCRVRALVYRFRGVRDAMQHARDRIDKRREQCDEAQQEPREGSARHEVSIT